VNDTLNPNARPRYELVLGLPKDVATGEFLARDPRGFTHFIPGADMQAHIMRHCWCRPNIHSTANGKMVMLHRPHIATLEVPDVLPESL